MAEPNYDRVVRAIQDFVEDKRRRGAIMVRLDAKSVPHGVAIANSVEDATVMIMMAAAIYGAGMRRAGLAEDVVRAACGEIGESIFKYAYTLSTKLTMDTQGGDK